MRPPSKTSTTLIDKFLHLVESVPGSDKLILKFLFFAAIATGIWFILSINHQFSAVTPIRGGVFNEGILGTPRFVNPVLALTRADQDVTALIYSGLMKIGPNGNLTNDLAESITISDDGLVYNIILRDDVHFHDGQPLTAEDVIYTIQLIKDPDLKSPLRGNWTDVIVEKINDFEINIVLKDPYAPFIENFTVGIMPAHAWSSLPIEQLPFSQLNTEPIGTGSFRVKSAERDNSGLVSHYTLEAFSANDTNPNIDLIGLSFYQNEELLQIALREHAIDATAYVSPSLVKESLNDTYNLIQKPLPRTFGIFFNQNKSPVLRDAAVREALTTALNRDDLIENVLFGYGVPINEPTTLALIDIELKDRSEITSTSTQAEQAIQILKEGGWKRNEGGFWEKEIDKSKVTLSVTVRTSSVPLFESLVDSIASQWKNIGIEVITEQFEQTGLVTSVIRPRDFEALLFGLDMSRSGDLYPFWHSSQQNDPGLNIAQYANVVVDGLLEKSRVEQNNEERGKILNEAGKIIVNENPAIFLFQPTLTYIVKKDVSVAEMNGLGRPADRWSNVASWHTESDSLWPFFRNKI